LEHRRKLEEELRKTEAMRQKKRKLREERKLEREMHQKLLDIEMNQTLRSKREDMRLENAAL